MKSIIWDKIMKHMRNNNLLSDQQFGFLDGHSTVLQLLVVLDKWTTIIDEEGSIDCIVTSKRHLIRYPTNDC